MTFNDFKINFDKEIMVILKRIVDSSMLKITLTKKKLMMKYAYKEATKYRYQSYAK